MQQRLYKDTADREQQVLAGHQALQNLGQISNQDRAFLHPTRQGPLGSPAMAMLSPATTNTYALAEQAAMHGITPQTVAAYTERLYGAPQDATTNNYAYLHFVRQLDQHGRPTQPAAPAPGGAAGGAARASWTGDRPTLPRGFVDSLNHYTTAQDEQTLEGDRDHFYSTIHSPYSRYWQEQAASGREASMGPIAPGMAGLATDPRSRESLRLMAGTSGVTRMGMDLSPELTRFATLSGITPENVRDSLAASGTPVADEAELRREYQSTLESMYSRTRSQLAQQLGTQPEDLSATQLEEMMRQRVLSQGQPPPEGLTPWGMARSMAGQQAAYTAVDIPVSMAVRRLQRQAAAGALGATGRASLGTLGAVSQVTRLPALNYAPFLSATYLNPLERLTGARVPDGLRESWLGQHVGGMSPAWTTHRPAIDNFVSMAGPGRGSFGSDLALRTGMAFSDPWGTMGIGFGSEIPRTTAQALNDRPAWQAQAEEVLAGRAGQGSSRYLQMTNNHATQQLFAQPAFWENSPAVIEARRNVITADPAAARTSVQALVRRYDQDLNRAHASGDTDGVHAAMESIRDLYRLQREIDAISPPAT